MTSYQLYPDHPVFGERVYIKKTESDGTTCHIPDNPQSPDYQEYLKWVAEGNTPEPAEDTNTWEHVRIKRDELIRDSDWTMIPGCTVDQAQWAAYRQTLRDIPATYAETGPESVVWPRKPSTSGPNTIDE
ncbi:MAG: phage tail assembly chaperone [Candidatus Poseidoniales archaeon]